MSNRMIGQNEEKVLFSWVHLSDIHFLHGSESHQVDQEMTLQAELSLILWGLFQYLGKFAEPLFLLQEQ